MIRLTSIALTAVCLASLALVELASAGNALTSSSYVGPAWGGNRPASPLTKAQRMAQAAPPRDEVPARPPLRSNVPVWRPPTVSPYLNLFQPGVSRVFNYYTLVRPQLVQEQINRQQGAQLESLMTQTNRRGPATFKPTQSGRFMNSGGFYQGGRR